jgi:DNA-binding NarL/FixJ family response regulator
MDTRHTLLIVGPGDDAKPVRGGLHDAAPQRVIEEATSYEEAMRSVAEWRLRIEAGDRRGPDLVVIDVRDAKVDAPRLLRHIRAVIDHKVAIVVLSRVDDPQFVRDCFRLDANAVVHRPDDPEKLREVAAAIGRYWLHVSTPVPSKPALQLVRGG